MLFLEYFIVNQTFTVMKKTKYFTFSFIFLISLVTILSCKDDETSLDDKSQVYTTLTSHPWVYDTFNTICNDPEILFWYTYFDSAFSASNYQIIFKRDYAFLGSLDGDAKWKLDNKETEVVIVDANNQTNIYSHFRIDEITDEILKLTDLVDVPPSDTCYVQFTYRK